ncbi:MAG: nucleotide exchange factor GrpE [Candidatus Magasanikbacteria bacterium]|nr:nucleotide exchange factor GrpE [Candidatus Magasanikbacteria bacterium]
MSEEPQKTKDEEVEEEKNNANLVEPKKTIEEVAEEYFNNWKRALADYDNLKKSIAREKVEMAQFARGMAAYEFASIYDNFKKAAAHLPEAGEDCEEYKKKIGQWAVGIDFIKKQFGETLKQLGLEEIKTAGEKFNPTWHEAAGEEMVEGVEPGLVLKEIEGGYKMGDKVVKAAKVIVSK